MYIRIVNNSLVCLIIFILFIASSANAINTFCCTGPSSESDHTNAKRAVLRAHDELNDYYKGIYDHHIKDDNGRSKARTIMTLQKYQPQHYVFCGHGYKNEKGLVVKIGEGSSEEKLYTSSLKNCIKTAGKTGKNYAALPFSVVVYMASYSYQRVTNFFPQTFVGNLGGMIFIGMKDVVSFWEAYFFLNKFYDKVTDGKKSYQEAYNAAKQSGQDASYFNDFKSGFIYRTYSHSCNLDKYRKTDRLSNNNGQLLFKNDDPATLFYSRDFDGTTNGAFFVFHGIINDDKDDIYNTADIRIKIERWVESQSQWILISNDLYSGVKNWVYSTTDTGYAGSDICSRYISASNMINVGTSDLKVKVTFESGTGTKIRIDRMELMEIGK